MLRAKYNKPKSGWEEDQERCRELLILDEVYDVYDVEVHSWHTDVYLCGFDEPFNSVNFTYYDENDNEVDLSDTEEWKYSDFLTAGRKELSMDEPVKKIKYVPVDAVKNFINGHYWLTSDFDELVDIYGIDIVHYKNVVTIDDLEMRAVKNSTDWMNITDYVKEVVASNLEEAICKHAKCTSIQHYPHRLNPEWHNTEYRYDIMIGEIPKRQQKGED